MVEEVGKNDKEEIVIKRSNKSSTPDDGKNY